jgi:hypothetical protein
MAGDVAWVRIGAASCATAAVFEPQQQRQRLPRIMPVAQKSAGERVLVYDMSFAHRHVPFGLRQTLLKRFVVRGRRARGRRRDQDRRRSH